MARKMFALILVALAGATVWWRAPAPFVPDRPLVWARAQTLEEPELAAGVRAAGIWRVSSNQPSFGGFSAMIAPAPDRLRLFADFGYALDLPAPAEAREGYLARLRLVGGDTMRKSHRDIEAATYHDGITWFGLEFENAIVKRDASGKQLALTRPAEMADWAQNSGPEALARLADGRFMVLEEGRALSSGEQPLRGLLFSADPTEKSEVRAFALQGDADYRPVDMGQLPDGRMLVLLRKFSLTWPLGFASRLAWFDPDAAADGTALLHTVADLGGIPNDNYEGLALIPRTDGLDAWIVSDDNGSHFQSTWLVKLELDPQLWSNRWPDEAKPRSR